ncbi:unnamed protein product [Leptosia nina]|uniref:SURP motif domain-containing protein n=1 Tax=Leptosia nina TaxID=320188 RepID=A0AAV1IY25_9NEOP
MSLKWTGSETGILRKSDFKEKKEELFVFGYSCKLFRDDERALHIDQGKHLIPWMGDESLKIDRYDGRGALHDLRSLEAPPGGYDWRVELTRAELDVEQLCDEERYRALHTDEDEEEMYKEEELKRLHAAGYGQVGFNYDTPQKTETEPVITEVEEPFIPSDGLKALLPQDIVFPETQKQNAIIEKTANFIASQGTQMEILIKAKQGENPQFKFLNKDATLHAYYMALIALVKADKWPEKKQELIEEKPPEVQDEYLHPSLAATIIESAPSIPSIQYKPSADCDYTMLISKMRGEATLDETYAPELAPGEVAPPGTEPLPLQNNAQISRAPVMYNQNDHAAAAYQQYAAYYHQYMAQSQVQMQVQEAQQVPSPANSTKSTGLSLMKNYNTDSDTDASEYDDSSSSDGKDKTPIVKPPENVILVIEKMAAYVARNGDEFADIVRAKNDPRFTFLDPGNVYYPFYMKLMHQKRGVGSSKERKKQKAPVSFSIKKVKDPDPILPKPALPYESSSDDDEKDQQLNNGETNDVTNNTPQILPVNNIPPIAIYKIETTLENNLPQVKTIEHQPAIEAVETCADPEKKPQTTTEPTPDSQPAKLTQPEEKTPEKELPKESIDEEEPRPRDKKKRRSKSESRDSRKEYDREKKRERESRRDNDRDRQDDRQERESKRERYESRRDRDAERRARDERDRYREEKELKRENDRHRKRRKRTEERVESEIINLEEYSDDMIDLTGDLSDSKVEMDLETDRTKQQERRRRAAEFLKKVGVDPSAAALPNTSLASAMVDTLESLKKKKAEEAEKRRRRDKRRKRDKYGYDETDRHRRKRRKNRSSDEDDSDCDGSKKRRHKKEKKQSSKNKRKKRHDSDTEEELPTINIDLTNTLKELRNASPTKEFGLEVSNQKETEDKAKKKKEREYSEGEWSSDSDEDSENMSE